MHCDSPECFGRKQKSPATAANYDDYYEPAEDYYPPLRRRRLRRNSENVAVRAVFYFSYPTDHTTYRGNTLRRDTT